MRNFKFLAPFAIGVLLTLGACEKDSKSSGGDPSTPEGKIEMAIAAIGTDGEKFISKLEKKGWSLYDDDSYEGPVYSKGDEYCIIIYGEDDSILVVQWYDDYEVLSDAKEALSDYHSATTEKYDKDYYGYCNGKSFDNPSDFIEYVDSAKESDLRNDAYESSVNSKKGIRFVNRFMKAYSVWKVFAAVTSIDY